MIDRDALASEAPRERRFVWLLVVAGLAAALISLGFPVAEGTRASAQIIRSHPMARRQLGSPASEGEGVYTINYFQADQTVVSERFMGKLAMAQERVDRAVAEGTAERAQIREGKRGNVIYRSARLG
jgi:hypothetical protein